MNNKEKDNLFYLCSLIEYIGRKTKNHRGDVVKKIGKEELNRLLDVSDVNHSLTIEQVSDEVINDSKITDGNFDIVYQYDIPSYTDIGANYQRLILDVNSNNTIDTLYDVFTSFISDEMSNFNSDFFYQNSSYIKECYKSKKILD